MIAAFLALALATTEALAHGQELSMHPREISSRQLAANRRHVVARNCASEIATYHRRRKMTKRTLMDKRQASTETTSALEPHETAIRNTTCVTAPEVTEGPYYLNNDLHRQDLREDQGGILLELDIGVIDTSTCQPLPSALVEIWHCNATGEYSGFSTTGDGGGGMGGGITDNYNFLRGGWETNQNGIVTFNTIFPGFYSGRTIHIHTMVHQNVTVNPNGTYSSQSGSLVHVGQMFFEETLANQVMTLSPYNETSMTRSYNADDNILAQENSAGYSAMVDASAISSNISSGILGFITLGVDTTSIKDVSSSNYYTGGDAFAVGGGTTGTRVSSTPTGNPNSATSFSAARGQFTGLKWLTTLMALVL